MINVRVRYHNIYICFINKWVIEILTISIIFYKFYSQILVNILSSLMITINVNIMISNMNLKKIIRNFLCITFYDYRDYH